MTGPSYLLVDRILQTSGPVKLPSNVHHHDLDLSSRTSVQSLVDSWSYGPLTSLIFNAGMVPGGKPRYDSHGVELCFAVNHVNQALLFFLMKEKNVVGNKCRIVFVTSALHDPKQPLNYTPPFWPNAEVVGRATDPKLENPGVRYSTAKLGTILFAYALGKKIMEMQGPGSSITKEWSVIAFEPGFVPGGGSRLQRGMSRASSPRDSKSELSVP